MATTKKKGSTARTSAKKKTKKTAAKTAAKAKKTSSAKTAKRAAPAKTAKRIPASPKKTMAAKHRRRRDPPDPEPLTGALTTSNGVLGISTDAGFFTLDRLAAGGESVKFVFQLGPERTSEITQALRGLVEFLESRAADDIEGVIRCCIS